MNSDSELWWICECQDLSKRIGAAVALEEAQAENQAFAAEATHLEARLCELQRWVWVLYQNATQHAWHCQACE